MAATSRRRFGDFLKRLLRTVFKHAPQRIVLALIADGVRFRYDKTEFLSPICRNIVGCSGFDLRGADEQRVGFVVAPLRPVILCQVP